MTTTNTTVYSATSAPVDVVMSMYPDSWVSVHCSAYADEAPILSLSQGGTSFTLSAPDRVVDDLNLRVARDLADAAAQYLAECERLHAEHSGRDGESAGTAAA